MKAARLRRPPYVDEVGRYLFDLPAAERAAVLDEVAANLAELGLPDGELDAWVDRLGPVRQYAEALRGGLGLPVDRRSIRRASRPSVRRASRRSKLILVVVLAAVVVPAGWLSWAHASDPLEFGIGGASNFGGDSATIGDRSRRTWTWEQGGRFAIGTMLTNTGRLPVRVTAIPLPPDVSVPWDGWEVRLERQVSPGETQQISVDAALPFTPFTLAAGSSRMVWFTGRFDRCPSGITPGGSLSIGGQRVEFELLGVHRVEDLDLSREYAVQMPVGGCA